MKMIKIIMKEVFLNIIYVIRIMFILNHYLFVWKRSSSIRSDDISNWRVRLTIGDGLLYLLPWSWGTVTSTCSFEELPSLSVQVIVIV